ncbi:MAG TPA: PilZ domain-containing protein [Stellaceae bacterium]|nr:PilZ domain-containing protein [Stellaceae bacterium]
MDAIASTAAPAAEIDPAERRRHQRIGVMWMGTLQAKRGYFDCMVIDVSLGGAKLAFGEPHALVAGTQVSLILERFGTFRAETVWQRAGIAGIRFLDPPETVAAAFGSILPA